MEDKLYENICDICSKPFLTDDEDATICDKCWEKILGENEGKGSDE